MKLGDLVNIKQAAMVVGVHPQTLRLWERQKKIQVVRTLGGHRRYRMSDLEGLLNAAVCGKTKL